MTSVFFILVFFFTAIFVFVFFAEKQYKSLLPSFYIKKVLKTKAQIFENLFYIKTNKNNASKYFIKQLLRWELLMLILHTSCFNDKYSFLVKTWLFNDAELQYFKRCGFVVVKKHYIIQLPVRVATTISFYRIHKDPMKALKFLKTKKQFFLIEWNPPQARLLYKSLVNMKDL